MDPPLKGGCPCGAVRYRVVAEPVGSAYCHRRVGQRRSGAPAAYRPPHHAEYAPDAEA